MPKMRLSLRDPSGPPLEEFYADGNVVIWNAAVRAELEAEVVAVDVMIAELS